MACTLETTRVQAALAALRAVGEAEDAAAKQRVRAREAELGRRLYGAERAALGAAAPLAVTPEVGQVLHALVLAHRPRLVVEFGTSLGVSTIYLATALRDLRAGSVIGTEVLAEKAARAEASLAAAGVADLVELRVGDARATLRELPRPVDLLFLDGCKDLYADVLDLLAPQLAEGALVAADMSAGDPHHDRYRSRVSREWVSAELALGTGLVLCTRPSSA